MIISVEPEESMTDYEKYIDEELQKSLPVVIAREIPEEPKTMREISRNAAILYERIDRERPVRPPREREAVTAMPEERPTREEISARRALENSTITKQIVSRKPAVIEDACKETCPIVKEQKGKQLAYFQEKLSAVISCIVLIFFSGDTYIHIPYTCISICVLQIKVHSYCRTHYAQIEGTAAGRRSLLFDERL